MPFTATIAPARIAAAAARTDGSPRAATGSPSRDASSSSTDGPHAGHAFGWAWKRRSRGSSYSARHAAHIRNPAIVVSGRAYGTPRTIVKRGPHAGRLVNGEGGRRAGGAKSAPRHAPQVAPPGGGRA